MEQKYDVFISYSRNDAQITRDICRAFVSVGLTYFTDRSNIPAGADYVSYIGEAIKNCKIFLYVASKNSSESKWSHYELNEFLKGQGVRQLIVYIVDDCELTRDFLAEFDKKCFRVRGINKTEGGNGKITDIQLAIELLKTSKTINLDNEKNGTQDLRFVSNSVFICHSHDDNAIAKDIYQYLTTNGINCWIDIYNIQPGKAYAQAIMEGLRVSDCVIVLYSKYAVGSHDMLDEIQEAHTTNKRIIPLLIDDTPLVEQFRYYLARRQWIVAYPNYKNNLEELLQALKGGVGSSYVDAFENAFGGPTKRRKISRDKIYTIIILLCFLIALFIGGWFFNKKLESLSTPKKEVVQTTQIVLVKDSSNYSNSVSVAASPSSPRNKSLSRVDNDSILTDKNTTLTKLARQYYDNTYCWVYIYAVNKSKLSSPNFIPEGIYLTIPKLTQEEMGTTKEQSLKVFSSIK